MDSTNHAGSPLADGHLDNTLGLVFGDFSAGIVFWLTDQYFNKNLGVGKNFQSQSAARDECSDLLVFLVMDVRCQRSDLDSVSETLPKIISTGKDRIDPLYSAFDSLRWELFDLWDGSSDIT